MQLATITAPESEYDNGEKGEVRAVWQHLTPIIAYSTSRSAG